MEPRAPRGAERSGCGHRRRSGRRVGERLALVALALLLASPPPPPAAAQEGYGDEQRRFLEVRRRQVELREARTELRRLEELFAEGLVSSTERDRAEAAVETAQLGYQQAVLSLLSLEPRISVERAVKHQLADGRRLVRLTVTNLTPTFDDSQFELLNNFEGADPIPPELRRREVRDVFISLREPGGEGAAGAAIALPYEVHLAELAYGASRTFEFQLLRDLDTVVVASSHRGSEQELGIRLEQAETDRLVSVTCTQISQEADLGAQATFDLRLERSSVDVRSYQLRVLNLPPQITYSFVDPESEARLSQITFPAGVGQRQLGLRLFLPDRADEELPIDRPLPFWAVVLDEAEAAALGGEGRVTETEIADSRAGFVRLEVIPRGVGRMAVTAPTLFSEVDRGQPVTSRITIRNTGTRRLDNVRVTADYPIDWRVRMAPDIVESVELNQEVSIELTIEPPERVPVGDYEIRLRAESWADNRPVPSEDKIYRVSVKSPVNVWGTVGLLGLLLATVVAIVVAGVRIARR